MKGPPEFGDLFSSALEHLLGPRRAPGDRLENRHNDIARSAQAMYEEALFHLLANLQQRSGLTALALAGGCAMNSVANGKVRRNTAFRRVYVQSAAGDAGGAIGSAFVVWHKLGGKRNFVMDHAYWGPAFDATEIRRVLDAHAFDIAAANCTLEDICDEAALCRRTADAIAKGQVVGWFQGRMEWGPRALGNRSILCYPRRPDMKAMLNDKIKRRESFRPFAPFGDGGSGCGMVRGGRSRSIHDASVSSSRREAEVDPCRDPRGWLWPPTNSIAFHQSKISQVDQKLPRSNRHTDGTQHVL
jgi:carbamoyltransferase